MNTKRTVKTDERGPINEGPIACTANDLGIHDLDTEGMPENFGACTLCGAQLKLE